MTLLRLQTTRQLAAEVNAGALNRPTPKIILTRKLEWFLCFVSLAALLFSNVSATISAFAFLTAAALFGLTVPIRAFASVIQRLASLAVRYIGPCLGVVVGSSGLVSQIWGRTCTYSRRRISPS